MKLDPKKCKEMLIPFLRIETEVPLLVVNSTPLEKVRSHKVLGVAFCDNFKWNSNIQKIFDEASTRLYLIHVLKRADVLPPHLVTNALVRSVLEYACPVWSNSLQQLVS